MIKLDHVKILDILRPAKVGSREVSREMGLSEANAVALWCRIQAGKPVHDKTAQSVAIAIEALIGRTISLADLRPIPSNGVPAK